MRTLSQCTLLIGLHSLLWTFPPSSSTFSFSCLSSLPFTLPHIRPFPTPPAQQHIKDREFCLGTAYLALGSTSDPICLGCSLSCTGHLPAEGPSSLLQGMQELLSHQLPTICVSSSALFPSPHVPCAPWLGLGLSGVLQRSRDPGE